MRELFARSELADLIPKVERGERLTREEGIRLYRSKDLLTVGYLADLVRRRKNGDKVYFIANRHINHTNICKNRCRLCAYRADKEGERAFLLSLREIAAKSAEVKDDNISEIHIVGGLHPDLPLDYYESMLRTVRDTLPGVHIQAFTAVEIEHLAKVGGISLEEVLKRLQAAGLGSLPGGGAEIFADRVRRKICPDKTTAEGWLAVHRAAHRIGMRSNASMLYGHIETIEERVDHLLALRQLQDETGGFQTFVAFPFFPRNTDLEGEIPSRTTGYDDLKTLAVARLLLDNFDHIKVFWIMVGQKLAQTSLHFGVDDMDGTVVEEKIIHDAGAEAGQAMTRKELVRLIRRAGFQPVERDTLYQVVREDWN